MSSLYHSFDPERGHGLPHDPIKAIIAPRPIGWISSLDHAGRANLAPYSFFNMVSGRPPVIMFSSEGAKDSVRNILATGEFVFNLAGLAQAQAMNITSGTYPADVDEFAVAGLDKLGSEVVSPSRVADAPAAMECRLLKLVTVEDLAGRPIASQIVFGQVVRVHIDKACLVDGLFDITRARTLARCGYRGDYVAVNETFEMLRPAVNLK